MRQIEGESGQMYTTVRIPDGNLGFTDKLLTNDQDWESYFSVSEERIATHFGQEARDWMGRIRVYAEEGWLKRETVSMILDNVFQHMEANDL